MNLALGTPSDSSTSSGDKDVRSSLNHAVNVLLKLYKAILREIRVTVKMQRTFEKLTRQRYFNVCKEYAKEEDSDLKKCLSVQKDNLKKIIEIHAENYENMLHYRKLFHDTRKVMKFLKGKTVTTARKPLQNKFGCDEFHSMLIEINQMNGFYKMDSIEQYITALDDDFSDSVNELYAKYKKINKMVNNYNELGKTEWKYLDMWFEHRLMEEARCFYI